MSTVILTSSRKVCSSQVPLVSDKPLIDSLIFNIGYRTSKYSNVGKDLPTSKYELLYRPVKDLLLSFYNGRLFRIVANYDRYRTEGMTAEDVVAQYPPLTLDDIRATIGYAATLAHEEELLPLR